MKLTIFPFLENRQAKIFLLSFCVVCWIPIIILFVNIEKSAKERASKRVEVRRWDSLNIKLTESPFNNGGVSILNDTLFLLSYKLNDRNLDILKIYTLIRKRELELPFYFKKAADNDTIWITDNRNQVFFWLFLKDRDLIKFDVELPDTIYREQQDIPIILRLENIRPEVLSINNPARWWNAYPQIKQGRKKVSIIKMNNSPANEIYETIHIRGNETLRIKYDRTLDELFNFKDYPSGKYNISFKFFYERKYNEVFENITLLKVYFSNREIQEKAVQYDEEDYIMSDRFTFYLK